MSQTQRKVVIHGKETMGIRYSDLQVKPEKYGDKAAISTLAIKEKQKKLENQGTGIKKQIILP